MLRYLPTRTGRVTLCSRSLQIAEDEELNQAFIEGQNLSLDLSFRQSLASIDSIQENLEGDVINPDTQQVGHTTRARYHDYALHNRSPPFVEFRVSSHPDSVGIIQIFLESRWEMSRYGRSPLINNTPYLLNVESAKRTAVHPCPRHVTSRDLKIHTFGSRTPTGRKSLFRTT